MEESQLRWIRTSVGRRALPWFLVLLLCLSLVGPLLLGSAASPGPLPSVSGVRLAGMPRSSLNSSQAPYWESSVIYGPKSRAGAAVASSTGSPYFALLADGNGSCGNPCNDTWYFTDNPESNWQNVTVNGALPGRTGAAMAWDSEMGKMLLFGGYNRTALGSTWTWAKGLGWSQLRLSSSPSPRSLAALYDDPSAGGVILFGGRNASGAPLNDTWIFRSGQWQLLHPSRAPTPRWGASMAFDGVTRALYLFGGTNGSADFQDLWEFSNGTWTPVSSGGPGAPPPRSQMGFQTTAGGYPLVYGGISPGGRLLNDTWLFVQGSWENLSGHGAPPPLYVDGLVPALDIAPNLFWLLGAPPNQTYGPLWSVYIPEGGRASSLVATATASVLQGTAPLTVAFQVTATGGNPPYQYSWDFGDSSLNSTLVDPTHRFQSAGVYTVTVTVTDSHDHRVTQELLVTALAAPPPPPPVTIWTYLDSPLPVLLVGLLLACLVVREGVRAAVHRRAHRRAWSATTTSLHLRPLREDLRDAYRSLRAQGRRPLLPGWIRERLRARAPALEGIGKASRSRRTLATYALRRTLVALGQLLFFLTLLDLVGNMIPEAVLGKLPPPPTVPGGPLGALMHAGAELSWFLRVGESYARGWLTLVGNLFTLHWGTAALENRPSISLVHLIGLLLPTTVEIAALAFALSVVLAYPLGLLAGWNRGKAADQASRGLSLVGLFLPTFLLVLVLVGYIYLAYVQGLGVTPFGSLPPTPWFEQHMGGYPAWVGPYGNTTPTGFPVIDAAIHGAWSLELVVWVEVLFPAAFVALTFTGIFLRHLRMASAEVRERLNLDFIRARGVGERAILWKHASRSVLPLYVSVFGETFPSFLLVQAAVEFILNVNGVGYTLLVQVSRGSFSLGGSGDLVTALLFLVAVAVIAVNGVSDVVSRWLDPRAAEHASRKDRSESLPFLPHGGIRRRPLPPPLFRGDGGRPEEGSSAPEPSPAHPSRRGLRLRRWWSTPSLATGTVLLGLFVAISGLDFVVFGSRESTLRYNPSVLEGYALPSAPTLGLWPWHPGPFPLGQTATLGFNVLTGMLKGTPWDLLLLSAIVAPVVIIGLLVGTYSGTRGGRTDGLLMALTDGVLSVPAFVFAGVIYFAFFYTNDYLPPPIFPPALRPVGLVLSMVAVLWAPYARSIRARARTVAAEPFVEAARASGASRWQTIRRHVIPHSFASALSEIPITVSTVLFFMVVIQFVYLYANPGGFGYGFYPPSFMPRFDFPEWTWVFANGMNGWNPPQSGADSWWGYAFPGLWILLFGAAVTLFCDGLRDYLSPFTAK